VTVAVVMMMAMAVEVMMMAVPMSVPMAMAMSVTAVAVATSDSRAVDRQRGGAQRENSKRRHNKLLDAGHVTLRFVQRGYRLL